MKLLITWFSPFPCYFVPLMGGYKYVIKLILWFTIYIILGRNFHLPPGLSVLHPTSKRSPQVRKIHLDFCSRKLLLDVLNH
jgi:hypothetical protein